MWLPLQWIDQPRLGSLHALSCALLNLPLLPPALQGPFAQLAAEARVLIRNLNGLEITLADQLVPLALEHEGMELADLGIRKSAGSSHGSRPAAELHGILARAEEAFTMGHPQAGKSWPEELAALQTEWQTHSPELLKRAVDWSEAGLIPPSARMALVADVAGPGRGFAHPAYNSARIERWACRAELPAVSQLLWLVLQLNLDLPRYYDDLHLKSGWRVGAWALLPVVLQATEDVGGGRVSDDLIRRAAALWIGDDPGKQQAAEKVILWWEVYFNRRPGWGTSLQALDRMLHPIAIESGL